jgi:hypothetical protein
MIPTLLLAGLVLGKWWRVVIPAATVGWVVVLVATDIGSGAAFVASAALFGVINLTVGVLVNQAMRALLHQLVGDQGALPS